MVPEVVLGRSGVWKSFWDDFEVGDAMGEKLVGLLLGRFGEENGRMCGEWYNLACDGMDSPMGGRYVMLLGLLGGTSSSLIGAIGSVERAFSELNDVAGISPRRGSFSKVKTSIALRNENEWDTDSVVLGRVRLAIDEDFKEEFEVRREDPAVEDFLLSLSALCTVTYRLNICNKVALVMKCLISKLSEHIMKCMG